MGKSFVLLFTDPLIFAFAPYGSRFRGHSIIMPKRHIDYVGRLKEKEFFTKLAALLSEEYQKG